MCEKSVYLKNSTLESTITNEVLKKKNDQNIETEWRKQIAQTPIVEFLS